MSSFSPPDLARRATAELRSNILPFWLKHAPEPRGRGFRGEVSDDLRAKDDEPRGALLTSRILWTFAAAWRRFPEPAYLDMARRAYADLLDRFWDEKYGGFFWSIAADGRSQRMRKQVYGQAFAIYALAEFHRATGEPEALRKAQAVFRLIEEHARDRRRGGYLEAYTREWKPEADMRLSAVDMNEAKSQNTLLHVMEACTNLLRVWPDRAVRESLATLLELMLTRVLDPRSHHLRLFFDESWAPRSDRISFGHDVEAAWLMTEAATALGDAALLERVRPVALKMTEVAAAEALDDDGGLLYEGDSTGIVSTVKEWWPQAEAVVGFLNAFELSCDPRWLETAERTWSFIERYLVDRTNGEWYRCVSRQRVPDRSHAKLSFWKCPYHNGRACLEVVARMESLAGQAAFS